MSALTDAVLARLGFDGSAARVIKGRDNGSGTFIPDRNTTTIVLANAITATGAQTAVTYGVDGFGFPCSFQLSTTGRGASDVTTVVIEVSNDNLNWHEYGYLTYTGNGADAVAGASAPWKYLRANCTVMDNPGTGSATVRML